MIDWTKYQYLTPNESWGDHDKMSPVLLDKLDAMCRLMQSGIFVTCGTQGIHDDNMGLHSSGIAVDFIPMDLIRGYTTLLDCFFMAARFGFTGIGLYPDWHYNGKRTGGLHVDIRPAQYMAQWLAVATSGTQVYIRLSESNLIKWGAIK